MSEIPELYPLNDFQLFAYLRRRDPATGREGPITDGTPQAFLSTANGPTATATNGLEATVTHVGAGKWLIAFESTALTPEALAPFTTATPYVILTHPEGIRVYIACRYRGARAAVIE